MYLGFYPVFLTETGYEGTVKLFINIMLATCLIKYGIAQRHIGSKSLQVHYTLTPIIMYPVFIAGLITSIDTMIFVIFVSTNLDHKSDANTPKNFFITNIASGFIDFSLKLAVMIAYYLIIKHVYMKLEQAKWVPCRDNNKVITNFDEIATYGTKTSRTSTKGSDSLSTNVK